MGVTFTEIPPDSKVIGKCQAMMANRMQCDRAEEYKVNDPENPNFQEIGLCKRHKILTEVSLNNTVNAVLESEVNEKNEPNNTGSTDNSGSVETSSSGTDTSS